MTLPVGQSPVLQNLQELVENRRMRLLDFVKQQNAERVLLHGVGQLPARLVADIAGRCAEQLLVGMALPVFAHVKADAGGFVAENLFCECLGGFGLARAGRPGEEQHALGLARAGGIRAVQPRHSALDDIQRTFQRRVLPLDALLEVRFRRFEALHRQFRPRIFMDAVLVQIHNAAQVANWRALAAAHTAERIKLGEAHAFGQPNELFPQLAQIVRMLLIIGHVRAVHCRIEERRPRAAAQEPHPLIAIGRFQRNRLANGVVQIKPRGQVVELVDQQNQQIRQLSLRRADGRSRQRRLQQEIKAVDLHLVEAVRRDDIAARHLHHDGGRVLSLHHGAADDVRRGIRVVPLELRRNRPADDFRLIRFREIIQHLRRIRVHQPHQIGIEHYLLIPGIGQVRIQEHAQRQQRILRHRTRHRHAHLIHHAPFQHQQRLYATKQFQFPIPARNQVLHRIFPLCTASFFHYSILFPPCHENPMRKSKAEHSEFR